MNLVKTIVFAGGCFWGTEAYYRQLKGVLDTEVGYAQGHTENPTYEQVCSHTTGYAEVVRVTYDPTQISLVELLDHLFRFIDPFAHNRQGNDIGDQYRTGIYTTDDEDALIVQNYLRQKAMELGHVLAVVWEPLARYYPAEAYHQDYLQKNPGGYCHVDLSLIRPQEKK